MRGGGPHRTTLLPMWCGIDNAIRLGVICDFVRRESLDGHRPRPRTGAARNRQMAARHCGSSRGRVCHHFRFGFRDQSVGGSWRHHRPGIHGRDVHSTAMGICRRAARAGDRAPLCRTAARAISSRVPGFPHCPCHRGSDRLLAHGAGSAAGVSSNHTRFRRLRGGAWSVPQEMRSCRSTLSCLAP